MTKVNSSKLTGAEGAIRRLRSLGSRSVLSKYVRRAVNVGDRLLLAEMKTRVRKQSGALSKSLGQKVRTFRGAVVGIIGPRSGFKLPLGVRKRGKNKGGVHYSDPRKYAHLEESGHAPGHNQRGPTRGSHFEELALASQEVRVMQAMSDELWRGLLREVFK